jgi:hypothetical protein
MSNLLHSWCQSCLETIPNWCTSDHKIYIRYTKDISRGKRLQIFINLSIYSKQVIPNALQVKDNLKLITVGQYLQDVSKGSYDEDEREFLAGFLDVLPTQKEKNVEITLPENIPEPKMNLNMGELNSFYNVCGYLVNSINNNFKTCSTCILSVGSKTANNLRFSKLTQIKRYKQNSLFFCNEITFLNFYRFRSCI